MKESFSMRLHGAILFAKDMDKLTAFYRDGFGLTHDADASQEGWVQFDAGGVLFALHAIPKTLAAGIVIDDPAEPRASTPIKLVFQTDDLTNAKIHLEKCGATMSDPIPGAGCDGWDPEGNVFHVVEA